MSTWNHYWAIMYSHMLTNQWEMERFDSERAVRARFKELKKNSSLEHLQLMEQYVEVHQRSATRS